MYFVSVLLVPDKDPSITELSKPWWVGAIDTILISCTLFSNRNISMVVRDEYAIIL